MGKYEKNKTEFIPIRVEPELKARLAAAASFEGVTISEMIRRLIRSTPVIGRVEGERVIWGDDTERE